MQYAAAAMAMATGDIYIYLIKENFQAEAEVLLWFTIFSCSKTHQGK